MNNSPETTKKQKPKTSLLTKVALAWAVFAILMASLVLPPVGYWPYTLLPIVGLAFGIEALLRARKDRDKIKEIRTVILVIVVNIGLISISLYSFLNNENRVFRAGKAVCKSNLFQIALAFQIYSSEATGQYPSRSKWCDLLMKQTELDEKTFICPGPKQDRCHYAMNPNCEPNSPGDMVLLFETKAGWNQHGGPELLTTENHRGKGSNILFNNGTVKFINKNQINTLKWK